MIRHRYNAARAALLAVTAMGFAGAAYAQSLPYTAGDHAAQSTNTQGQDNSVEHAGPGEHYTAHGKHNLPPGYQDTPSNDINHGPDPDHLSTIQRDPVTGANLTKFGSSYTNSSPTQQGSLGDATGNGWVAPR
ncbi:hypothetical protein Tasa_017_093 [Tanticharoenia sakaeratensis NBRC 103193]|uniref:Uncharacterized protein n=2 Tax=Tanticharoenia TaxID=444052 RepID=A0A0D6ML77_9PROT|nr:hypothetical protein Tasa_017_093 [Tanticharoenia sakaeratensis NBRC 103193]GBQ19272.1 hypothetical protein AA103193_0972 [Tanticharoenia sakaeratensis NBRC 103193]